MTRGRGRGGVVRRSQPETTAAGHVVAVVVEGGTPDTETMEAAITNEPVLDEPMRAVIERDWAQEHRQDLLAVEITAFGGSRPTGIWSRPAITTVEVRTFEYVPGKHLDVNTFEIKSPNAVNVQAVYEALAHRRARPGPTCCSTSRRRRRQHSSRMSRMSPQPPGCTASGW